MSRVTATLLLGDAADAASGTLRQVGITHVINVAKEITVSPHDAVYKKCAIEGRNARQGMDYYEWKMTMAEVVDFISEALRRNDYGDGASPAQVLICCSNGNSRGALAASCYLLAAQVRGTLWECFELVRASRPGVSISAAFAEFVGPYERDVGDMADAASALRSGMIAPTDPDAVHLPEGGHVVMGTVVEPGASVPVPGAATPADPGDDDLAEACRRAIEAWLASNPTDRAKMDMALPLLLP